MSRIQLRQMKGYLWYMGLFLCAVGFLLFYSVSTSPLTYNTYGEDSAFFQMVGQNMRKGLVMYRDIFDTKGPYLFFIQYVGQMLWPGRYGIFIIQILHLFCTLLLIDKTFSLVCGQVKPVCRAVTFLVYFVILSFTLDCGNLVEEYSLFPLMLCLYLFFRYLKNGRRHSCLYALIVGGVFGYLAFIRLTNASFVCILVCVIFVELLRGREFRLLSGAAVSFLAGIAIAALPVCVYYASQKALSDMLYATFTFGFMYAVREPGIIRYGIVSILIVTAVTAAMSNRKEASYRLFSILSAAGMVLILLLGKGYIHYYQLLLPPILGNLFLIFREWDHYFTGWGKKVFLTALSVSMLTNSMLFLSHGGRVVVALGLNTPQTENTLLGKLAHELEYLDPHAFGTYGYGGLQKIEEVMENIPAEAMNSVYNYATRPAWLLVSDYPPYNKYCITPELFMQIDPEIEAEIDEMFVHDPPDYVVTEKGIQSEKIENRLLTMYHIVFSNDIYTLYERAGINVE